MNFKHFSIFSLILFILFLAPSAQAADLRFSAGKNPNFVIEAQDNVKNLYTAGPQLIINANSAKDTVAAGGVVFINGSTADDLIVAGGTVNVRGNVGGSMRALGGNVIIDGKIEEDLVVIGGNVFVTSSSSIGGDVLVLGGDLTIHAPVRGNIKAATGSLVLNNSVLGNIDVRVGERFRLGPNTNVKGNVNYSGRSQFQKDDGAVISGTVNYTPKYDRETGGKAAKLIIFIIKLLAEFFAALVLYLLFRKRFADLVYEGNVRPGRNLLFGILILIVVPILAVLLLFTVIGYYISLILGFWYILMLLLSWIIGLSVFGVWLKSKVTRMPAKVDFGGVALGIVLGTAITAIHIIGLIFGAALLLIGLGTFFHAHYHSRQEQG